MKKGNKGKIRFVEGKGWYVDAKFPYGGKYLHVFHRWYGTYKQAESDMERLRAEAIERFEEEALKASPALYDNFVEDWLSYKRTQVCPSTMFVYRSTVRTEFDPLFRGKDVSEAFSPSLVSAFYGKVTSKRIGPQAKNQMISRFKDMLRYAYQLMLIDARQFQIADVRTPLIHEEHHERKEPRFVTDAEIDRFIAQFEPNTRDWVMFKLAVAVGMRVNEFLALTGGSFDFSSKTVRVNAQMGLGEFGERERTGRLKSALSYRTIPLDDETAEMMRSYIEDMGIRNGDRLFPFGGSTMMRKMAAACRKASLEPFSFHAFRHHLAKKLSERCFTDEDRIARSNMLGHSPSVDMDVYASHDTSSAARRLISKA